MKKILAIVCAALFLLAACSPPAATPAVVEQTPVPTPQPTPEPTPTPIPEVDYGRKRDGEYVYRDADGAHYHEADCPNLYGSLDGLRMEEAKRAGLVPMEDCVELGRIEEADFPLNLGFTRTMRIQYKALIVSGAGEVQDPIIYVTTGDPFFDLNKLDVNYTSRYFYKELKIDPAYIEVYVREGGREYHAALCQKIATERTRTSIFLQDAYDAAMTACKDCSAPIETYFTLPILCEDGARFFMVSQSFIRRVTNLRENEVIDENMNLDMNWIENGYLEGAPKPEE